MMAEMAEGTNDIPLPKGLRLVTRDQWGAVAPHVVKPMKHPLEHVCFSYNIGTKPCDGDEECFKVLKQLQKEYRNNGMSDIPYNFLVGGDGTMYEGRGWHAHSSSSLGPPRVLRLDIAFIGEFALNLLYMYDAALEYVYYGVDKNYIKKTFKLAEKHNGIKEKLLDHHKTKKKKHK